MKKLILNLGLLAALCWPAAAGETITYQGRLKEGGVPADGNRDFAFEFCATPAPSGCVASPDGTQSFQVANGLFKSTFTAPSVNLAAGPWYLRVKVGADYLSPVERLTAVPYAVQAASSAYASALAVASGEGVLVSTHVLVGGAISVGDWYVPVSSETILAAFGAVQNRNPGAEDVRVGVMGYVKSASTDPNDVVAGGNFEAETPSGMAAGMAVGVRAVNRNEGGTIGTAYGVMIDSLQNSAGTVGQAYGLYVGTMTEGAHGARPYALYSVDKNALAHFAGPVGISSVPAYSLAVSSANGDLFWVAHDGVYANKFVGDGSGLTGVTGASGTDNTRVLKTGDFMSGQLTIGGSSLTVRTGDTVHMAVDTSGKMGINSYPDGSSGLRISGSAIYEAGVTLENGASRWGITNDASVLKLVKMDGATFVPLSLNANGDLYLFRGAFQVGASTLTVRDGQVGVGTAAPGYRLHVSSGAGMAGTVMAVSTGATNVFWVAGDGAYATRFVGNGSGLTGVPADLSNPVGTLDIGDGGTGGYSAATARANLGAVNIAGDTMTGTFTLNPDTAVSSNSLVSHGLIISTSGAISTYGNGTGYVAGDPRGLGAVDLQTARLAAGQAASGNFATVSGGHSNTASGNYSAAAGGNASLASGQMSFVGGGNNNTASGGYSSVPGGDTNSASGLRSFAAGFKADSSADGAFTWADSEGTIANNAVADRARFKARGGFLVSGSTNAAMTGLLDRGLLITGNGLVGISTGVPYAALDVVSSATAVNAFAQVWRNASGVIVASMSSTGAMAAVRYVGDGSGLTGVTGALGTDDTKVAKAGDFMTGQLTLEGSSLTVNALGTRLGFKADATGGHIYTATVQPLYLGTSDVNDRLMIDANGKVGINRTSLNYRLEVGGPAYFDGQAIVAGTMTVAGNAFSVAGSTFSVAAGKVGINSDPGAAVLTIGAGTSNEIELYSTGSNVQILATGTPGQFQIGGGASFEVNVNGANRLVVDGFGNVGIDAAAPEARLDLKAAGSGPADMAQIWRNSSGVIVSSVSATGYLQAARFIGDGSGLTGVTGALGTDDTKVAKTGDTMTGDLTMSASSITVSNLGTQLGFSSDVGGGRLRTITGQALYFGTGGTDRMFIDNLGQVAINKTPANYRLDVNGPANFDGQAIVGGTMTVKGGDFSVAGSTLVVTNGRVGVGVNSPGALLDVAQNDALADGLTLTAAANTAGRRVLHVAADGGATVALSVRGNGRIGLGTEVPQSRLDVVSGSITVRGTGAALVLSDASRSIFPEADSLLGGGIRVSTNVFIVGFSSAGRYFGDGSGLTGVPGDSLGTHTAAHDLNLANYSAVNVASVTMTGKGLQIGTDLTGSASGIFISTYGSIVTLGVGHVGSVAPFGRGNGAVDLQTYRNSGSQVAIGHFATLSGGAGNSASNAYSVVAGGYLNRAAGAVSVVSGGQFNTAIGHNSIVLGGKFNVVGGQDAVVSGSSSSAAGDYSWAGGYLSSATAAGSFTWADSQGLHLYNPYQDRTLFKNRGGFMITGSTNTSLGGALDRGVFVTGGGMVGISTGVPWAALDVVSTGTLPSAMAQIWRDSGGVIRSSVSATGVIMASKFVGDGSGLTGVTASGSVLRAGDTMTGQLTLAGSTLTVTGPDFSVGGGTLAVRDGRVGILTASPVEALDIGGRIMISTSAGNESTDGLYSYGLNGMKFSSNGNDYMRVAYNGSNVGLGGPSVFQGATYPRVQVLGNMSVGASFASSLPPPNSLVAEGPVGIGTATPTALLEVRDRNATSGYVLRVGTGTDNWSAALVVTTGAVVGAGTLNPSTQTVFHAQAVARDFQPGIEDVMFGVMGSAQAKGTGTEDAAAGGHFEAYVEAQDSVGYLVGLHTNIRRKGTGAGTVNKAIGLYIDNVENQSDPNSIDDTIGLFIATMTTTGQRYQPYAIFSADPNARSYFAGPVGIGSHTAQVALVISSAPGSSDPMLVISTGSSIVFGVKGNGEVYAAGKYYGDGSALTGVLPTGAVLRAGDSMTGQLTLYGSTLTVGGGAFSVGGSTFTVAMGKVGIGTEEPLAMLEIRDEPGLYDYLLMVATGTAVNRASLAVSSTGAVSVGTLYPSTQTLFHAYNEATDRTFMGADVSLGLVGSVRVLNSGVEDAAAGAHFEAEVEGDSVIGIVAGLHTSVRKNNGTGSIGKSIGVYIDDFENEGGGLITDTYGVYIGTISTVNQANPPYAVYAEDPAARSYFAGRIGISSAAPAHALVVSSAAGTSEVMLVVSTGSSVIFGVKGNGEVYTAGKYIGDGSLLTNLNISSITVPEGGLQIATSPYAGASGIIISTGGAIQTTGIGHGLVFGAARGLGAVDLQTSREGAGQAATGAYSVISGGLSNTAAGSQSVIGGGIFNVVSGSNSAVGGGAYNVVSATSSVIAGGEANIVAGNQTYISIGGGLGNSASAQFNAISGGWKNRATMWGAAVGGGVFNTASGSYAAIPGGSTNTASGYASSVGGGDLNSATANYASIGGGTYNNVFGAYSFVGGGAYHTVDPTYAVVAGGTDNKIPGGADYAFVGGGKANSAGGLYSFVGGGGPYSVDPTGNTAAGQYSAVVGGSSNTVTAMGTLGFIGGGWDNRVLSDHGVIGGGSHNRVGVEGSKFYASILGGHDNSAYGEAASVGGGSGNWAVGQWATVPGGRDNSAVGNYSFAAGYLSSSTLDGSFTWADSQGTALVNQATDQTMFRNRNGFWVSTGTVFATPAIHVNPSNNVNVGGFGPSTRLTVLEQSPQLTTGNKYTLRVGTGSVAAQLTVSTSGIVSMPMQSVVLASMTATMVGLPSGTWSPIAFSAILRDTQGEMLGNNFRPSTPGRYLVVLTGHFYLGSGGVRAVGVALNGEATPGKMATGNFVSGMPTGLTVSNVFDLAPGDSLQFMFRTTDVAAELDPFLSVVKLN